MSLAKLIAWQVFLPRVKNEPFEFILFFVNLRGCLKVIAEGGCPL